MCQCGCWSGNPKRQLHCQVNPDTPCPLSREERPYTTTTERKFWGTSLAAKKNFSGRWWIREPHKNRKTISTTEFFPLCPSFFRQRKFLTGAGRCMLSFSLITPLLNVPDTKCDRMTQLISRKHLEKVKGSQVEMNSSDFGGQGPCRKTADFLSP